MGRQGESRGQRGLGPQQQARAPEERGPEGHFWLTMAMGLAPPTVQSGERTGEPPPDPSRAGFGIKLIGPHFYLAQEV